MSVAVIDASAQAPTLGNRCDRCGAQAFVTTQLPSGHELLWCGHHYVANEPSLREQGAAVIDDHRHMLSV